jgi:hypothetical protein
MSDVVTTTIRLDPNRLRELKRRALEQDRSLASLIRQIVDDYLHPKSSSAADELKTEEQRKAITEWAGTSLGDGFSGREHDEVLYGDSQ